MNSISEIFGRNTVYRQLLKTDEWKSFARNVRRLHNNACQICRRSNLPNNVHHLFYDANRKPWEYSTDEVMLLCQGCHKEMHDLLNEFRKYVFQYLKPDMFRILNGALLVGLTKHHPLEFCYAIAELASSPGSVQRFSRAWKGETGGALGVNVQDRKAFLKRQAELLMKQETQLTK